MVKNSVEFEELHPEIIDFSELHQEQEKGDNLAVANEFHTPAELSPLEIIRKLDNGDGVLTDEIAKGLKCSVGELYPHITKLASNGDIFENTPDRWKVLE